MREFQCIQARSIIKAFLEVITNLEEMEKEAEDIGGVWKENILPAFHHIKKCQDPRCRAYLSKLQKLLQDLDKLIK